MSGSAQEIEIRSRRYDAPVARALVAAAMADLGERYGGHGDGTPVRTADFDPPHGEFLVAYLDGVPVGCGAWRSHGDTGEVAEIKRMYTAPQARKQGVAREILRAVEDSARRHGRRRVILECGDRQPEAIALYTSCGYQPIENFGHYRDEPGVVSLGRPL